MENISFVQLLSLAIKELAQRSGNPHSCWINENPAQLHAVMKEITEQLQEELPPLTELHFHEAGAFPYSAELSQALDLLQQSGLIRRENPSFDRFRPTWHDDSPQVLKELKGEFFRNEQELRAFDRFLERLQALRTEPAG